MCTIYRLTSKHQLSILVQVWNRSYTFSQRRLTTVNKEQGRSTRYHAYSRFFANQHAHFHTIFLRVRNIFLNTYNEFSIFNRSPVLLETDRHWEQRNWIHHNIIKFICMIEDSRKEQTDEDAGFAFTLLRSFKRMRRCICQCKY